MNTKYKAAGSFTPRNGREVTCHELWYRYIPESAIGMTGLPPIRFEFHSKLGGGILMRSGGFSVTNNPGRDQDIISGQGAYDSKPLQLYMVVGFLASIIIYESFRTFVGIRPIFCRKKGEPIHQTVWRKMRIPQRNAACQILNYLANTRSETRSRPHQQIVAQWNGWHVVITCGKKSIRVMQIY